MLTGSHRRTAYALTWEIVEMAREFGVEFLGFLTLTFADNVQVKKEAYRRFNSLRCHVIKDRYRRAVAVWERQVSGRWHVHLLAVLHKNIRSGIDFEALEKGDYRTANEALRSEWAFWRATAPKYRFGRTELLPVKSSADGIARYVGKYIPKGIGSRQARDVGLRMVSWIGFRPGDRKANSRFSWANGGGWLWRQKLGAWASSIGVESTDELKRLFGSRWAYFFQVEIMEFPLASSVVYPDERTGLREMDVRLRGTVRRDRADREKERHLGKDARVYELHEGRKYAGKSIDKSQG